MKYQVLLVADAEEDLFEIYQYVAHSDSVAKADWLLGKLQGVCESLSAFPQRGHCPPELSRVEVGSFLEVHFKPYRVIYRIEGRRVFVHCVLDGRRSLQDLLQRRLLRQ